MVRPFHALGASVGASDGRNLREIAKRLTRLAGSFGDYGLALLCGWVEGRGQLACGHAAKRKGAVELRG